MDFFSAWLKNIVIISATVTLLHLLLPSSMGKYVKIITGFVVMLVIVQPFTNVLNTDIYLQDLFLKHNVIMDGVSLENPSVQAQENSLETSDVTIEIYKGKLTENIEENIEQNLDIVVQVELDIYEDMDESNFGTLKEAKVVVLEGEKSGLVDTIEVRIGEEQGEAAEVSKKTVKDINNFFLNFYNLDSENISISKRN